MFLTHWGRVTHICVGKLIIIGSDNGLSPGRRQAIIWTNAGMSLIGSLGINFSEILIAVETFSFMKMHLEMSSGKCRPFCLGLNVLNMYANVSLQWITTVQHVYIDTKRQNVWHGLYSADVGNMAAINTANFRFFLAISLVLLDFFCF